MRLGCMVMGQVGVLRDTEVERGVAGEVVGRHDLSSELKCLPLFIFKGE